MGQNCCKEKNVCNKMTSKKNIDEILEEKHIPKNIDLKNYEYYVPDIEEGRVFKIYDGDTITIVCRPKNADGKLYKYSVRIAGVDCPELITDDKDEQEIAKKARDKLGLMLFKNMVQLKNIKLDKYNKRIVADVWYEDINISEWLIENRFAVPYDGGKKNPPKSWVQYHLNKDN